MIISCFHKSERDKGLQTEEKLPTSNLQKIKLLSFSIFSPLLFEANIVLSLLFLSTVFLLPVVIKDLGKTFKSRELEGGARSCFESRNVRSSLSLLIYMNTDPLTSHNTLRCKRRQNGT